MEEKEIKAMISLLEDDDQQVSQHVEQQIRTLGTVAIPFLEREWESNLNPEVQQRIELLIHDLQFQLSRERLKDWYSSPGRELMTGMWIVASIQYPDLQIEKIRHELEQIYYEVWLQFRNDMTVMERIKVLNSVLFTKLRFGSNTKNFHSPGNSMINVVLESKKGNPITLCVIYLLVARKLKQIGRAHV